MNYRETPKTVKSGEEASNNAWKVEKRKEKNLSDMNCCFEMCTKSHGKTSIKKLGQPDIKVRDNKRIIPTLTRTELFVTDTTFTFPLATVGAITATLGGGGGGGGAAGFITSGTSGGAGGGGGGGGSGFAFTHTFSSALVSSIKATIGPGGAGGKAGSSSGTGFSNFTPSTAGFPGGTSFLFLNNASTPTLTARGGVGGQPGLNGTSFGGTGGQGGNGEEGGGGGGGGSSTNGTVGSGGIGGVSDSQNSPGSRGTPGTSTLGGNGGNGSGNSQNGGISTSLGSSGGGGGGTHGGAGGTNTSVQGINGAQSGGGGGGGMNFSSPTSGNGGNGGSGFLLLTFQVQQETTVETSIVPSSGPAGSSSVMITGSGFLNQVKSVLFGTLLASFSIVNDSTIFAIVPSGLSPGSVQVSLNTQNGTTSTLTFTVVAADSTQPTCNSLGAGSTFALFSNSSLLNSGISYVNGNVGINNGNSLTGFPPGLVISPGSLQVNNSLTSLAATELLRAYNSFQSQTSQPISSSLGGLTLTPGVYQVPGNATLNGTLTLDFQGNPNNVFVFQLSATLILSQASIIVAQNNTASSPGCNVFWVLPGSLTIGSNSTVLGNFITLNGNISVGGNTVMNGRLAALGTQSQVSFNTSIVNVPQCVCT